MSSKPTLNAGRSHGGIRVSVTAARDHRRIDQLRLAVRPR